ncbi:hypothetical protein NDU88_000193 [Pleurodeles waltl]|uniref:Uncharacterized protein n=1 Tax=Pleurodeles waltl TaxID=8319 RepID=A0AAV7LU55_PLEWA|nr:hypothetical protein NDU88_000193 [Pleurodeles waltl]
MDPKASRKKSLPAACGEYNAMKRGVQKRPDALGPGATAAAALLLLSLCLTVPSPFLGRSQSVPSPFPGGQG